VKKETSRELCESALKLELLPLPRRSRGSGNLYSLAFLTEANVPTFAKKKTALHFARVTPCLCRGMLLRGRTPLSRDKLLWGLWR